MNCDGVISTSSSSLMAASNSLGLVRRGLDGGTMPFSDTKVAEEVSFICNNLSSDNLSAKARDMKKILIQHDDSCRKWLAQYLVRKRITQEQNLHDIYNKFLVNLDDRLLCYYVKQETLRSIKTLLKSDKKNDPSTINDRQLLKNLGHWLGLLTIGRNLPLVMDDLNLRDLLLEAFYKGQQELSYVVPFVAKILMASKKSWVFSPSCAWVKQILHILAEIHQLPDLTLHLNFEIEVLCNELGVDLQKLETDSSLLTDERIHRLTDHLSDVTLFSRLVDYSQNSESSSNRMEVAYDPLRQPSAVHYARHVGMLEAENIPPNFHVASNLRQSTASPLSPQFAYEDVNIYENLEKQIKIPNSLLLFQRFPGLAEQCRKTIAVAVLENLDGMVEKTITSVLPTTTEIIKKDFGQCPDYNQVRKASHDMVISMTTNIGMITNKEPLSTAMLSHVRNIFNHQIEQLGSNSDSLLEMFEDALVAVIKRNIEYVCCFVIKHAVVKAKAEIDKYIEDKLFRRRSGNKLETSSDVLAVMDKLPRRLRPLDRPLKEEDMAIYEEFENYVIGFKASKSPEEIYAERSALTSTNRASRRLRTAAMDEMGDSENIDFQRQAEYVFREWINICSHDPYSLHNVASYLPALIQQYGIAFNEENMIKQIKIYLDICTDVTYRLLGKVESYQSAIAPDIRSRCYRIIDAFSMLVCALIWQADRINGINKVQLLHRSLDLINNQLLSDHDRRRSEFNGLPFLRIFVTMIKELCQNDPEIGSVRWAIIEAFGHTLYYVQPRRAPAFAFHWLQVVGHRVFIRELLANPNAPPATRAIYTQLLLAQLKFLAPVLRNMQLSKAFQELYKGTLRIMLIIVHDFPELFCEFYYVFCDVIPPNCIQLRNLVLSAYPRSMRLPDPFNQNFDEMEGFAEMNLLPKIPIEMFNLIPHSLRNDLDAYLTTRGDVTFLPELASNLENGNTVGSKYNVPALNAIINYVGVRAINHLRESQHPISIWSIAHSAYMDVFQSLAATFCSEGRYILFNALANQLRYPNAQTHYFACTLLYLFESSTNIIIKEQITRILFERLVSLRPHPWGLLVTFIELMKNEQYKFWSYDFVHCSPEIYQLFLKVAASCQVTVPAKFVNNT